MDRTLLLKLAPAALLPPASRTFTQWRVMFAREWQTALLNRFVHLLGIALLLAGLAPLAGDYAGAAAPFFLVQAVLYLVPLFALLIGVGSAQSDLEERAFLLSQPVSRNVMLLGRWAALWVLMSLGCALLIAPALVAGASPAALGFLGGSAAALSGVFLAVGIAFGLATPDRVRAHLAVLCAWFALLAGGDLLALGLAQMGYLRETPTLWLLLLMFNPLDAFRIGALFSLDSVPLEVTHIPPLGRWWLAHPGLHLALLCGGWMLVALGVCAWRLRRMEVR